MYRKALFLLALGWAVLPAQKLPVTIEAITGTSMRMPDFGGTPNWAPDGRRFVITEGQKIIEYDVPSGKTRDVASLADVSKKALRPPAPAAFAWQNRRVASARLQWSEDGKSMLAVESGDLFLLNVEKGEWTQLTVTAEAEEDPRLSPDARRVAFRKGNELYALDIESKKITRLTHDATETLWNGRLDWVYPEELDLGRAYWWSPDSKWIAYLQFDVSREMIHPHIDLLPVYAVYEPQRYPKAGTPNADVRVGVVSAAGGATRWMNLGETREMLTARVHWMPGSRALAVQRLTRVQDRLDLVAADVQTGESKLLVRETCKTWINLHDMLRFFEKEKLMLWASERDGFRHLYLYNMEGRREKQITRGDWEVTSVEGIDEANKKIYFVSTAESPLERHLYRVGFGGGRPERLTKAAGSHTISMGPAAEFYLDSHSSLTQPTRRTLHSAGGAELRVYREADRGTQEKYDLRPVEIVKVKAAGGDILYAKLIRPAGFEEGRKYPAVVFVYGGPHAQSVRDSWPGMGWEQVLAHKGFVIWQLDNRGSSGRGHLWESKLYRRMGKQELEDQQHGVEHLVSMGFVDPKRVGITGWSYGGYMTLYALLHAPDVFAAGVSGAPVTDWRHYDTIYTERYLGLPSENEAGYRDSSPVHAAANLKGKLLLVHNLEDDNVLFQNALHMMNALQRAGKHFETMFYPIKSHGVTGPARKHSWEAMTAFFEKSL